MVTTTVSAVLVWASLGLFHCGHDKVREECTVCTEEAPAVLAQISRLESCSGWMARRKAARVLRRYDWKSHPEAAEALSEALLHDDCNLVRQEAAESLARMRPCLPDVHAAVLKAAKCDPSLLTRCAARKALKSLGKSCIEPCSICGPADVLPGEVVLPMPPSTGPLPLDSTVEPLPAEPMEVPGSPSDLSPFSPGASPPLPSAVPGPAMLRRPVAPRTPVVEGPSLTGPLGLRGPRPNLAGTLLGSDD